MNIVLGRDAVAFVDPMQVVLKKQLVPCRYVRIGNILNIIFCTGNFTAFICFYFHFDRNITLAKVSVDSE